MTKIKSYKDLIVWQKGIELVVLVYRLTEKLPREEIYGITSQIRRAVLSIPANIAEGHRRNHLLEFIQFLSIANGSAAEIETYLEIIKRLNYLNKEELEETENLLQEVLRMLNVLIRNLKNKSKSLNA